LYVSWFIEQSFMNSIVFGVSDDQMSLEDELGMTQKGIAVVQFKLVGQHLPGGQVRSWESHSPGQDVK
jgi:hypothetical protein